MLAQRVDRSEELLMVINVLPDVLEKFLELLPFGGNFKILSLLCFIDLLFVIHDDSGNGRLKFRISESRIEFLLELLHECRIVIHQGIT